MWSSFLFSANIVLPSFLLILLGRLLTMANLITTSETDRIGKLAFRFVIPARIFLDVALNDPSMYSDYRMTLFIVAAAILLFCVIWALAARFMQRKESVGSFVQTCFRCSFTVLGLSMVESFAGADGVARCVLLLAAIVIVFNVLASIVLIKWKETPRRGERALQVLKSILSNPLIIASALGIVFSCFRIPIPFVFRKTIEHVGNMATPLTLLCIGAGMNLRRVKQSFRYAVIASAIKTLGQALIIIPVAVLLGFRGFELTVIAIFFTAANPSSNYVMALANDADTDLAATGIVLSTVMCLFTSMAAVTILRSLHLI